MGAYNSASGNWCGTLGTNNSVSGYYSFGGGSSVSVSSTSSFSWGDNNALSGGIYQYSFGDDNDITTSSYSGIFGGRQNRITGSGNRNVIIGSSASTINNLSDVIMLGTNGRTATTSATTYVENIRGFRNFNFGDITNTDTSTNGGIAGGQSNTNSSTRGVIAGGNDNTASGTNNFIAGQNNTASGWNAYILGYNNQVSAEIGFVGGGNSCNLQGQTNGIIGAEQSRILGSTSNTKQSFIGGGFGNQINTSLRASIIAGQSNTITSSPDSAIIGGTGNTISNKSKVVMLGCNGRTAIVPDATHLEALVLMTPLTEYANNAAAKAGGLLDGQLYRDNSGAVHIVFT